MVMTNIFRYPGVLLIISSLLGPEIPKDANPLIKKASTERWNLWTLENGLETLVETLEAKLLKNGVNIVKNSPVVSMKFVEDGTVEVQRNAKGGILLADHVISSISSKGLATFLPEQHSTLAGLLGRIDAVTVGVVNVEFEGSVLQFQGFGYLCPSSESTKVLGVIFDSSTFPQGDSKSSFSTRLTVRIEDKHVLSLAHVP